MVCLYKKIVFQSFVERQPAASTMDVNGIVLKKSFNLQLTEFTPA